MTTIDKKFRQQRRQFLDLISKAGISSALMRASPLVGGMMVNRFAEAQGIPHKRVIFMSFPGGAPRGTWMPSSINNMNQCTQPYASVAQYCNFHSVNVIGGGHGASHAALGSGSNTMDTRIADVIGVDTPYSAVNLGVEVGTSNDVIGRKNGQVIKPEDDPQRAFNQLFQAAPPGGAAQALYEKQKAILDKNKEAINALMPKLALHERERLNIHLEAIERLDKRLNDASQFMPLPGCSSPSMPSHNDSGVLNILKQHTDVAVTAMRCGLTNVVTIQLDDSQCDWRYSGSFSEGHHQTCHGRGRNDVIEIMQYLGQAGAYAIDQLAKTDDPNGGKMLDNTAFMQVTDMGDGMTHVNSGAPNILATNIPAFNKGTVGGGGSNHSLLSDLARGLGLGDAIAAGKIPDHESDHAVLA